MAENWIDSATEFAADSLAGVGGGSVVYSNGTVSLNIRATISATERTVIDANGHAMVYTSVDFLIRSKRLQAGSVPFLPAKNHTISRTNGTATETYTVLPIPGGNSYDTEDQYGALYRVHTKLTGTA